MTPGARVSAAIECLDQIFEGTPAEKVLTRWARGSRFAGSKDRAAVRDHVFDALRRRNTCAQIGGALTGRGVMIGLIQVLGCAHDQLFSGEGHAPAPLSVVEADHLESIGRDALGKEATQFALGEEPSFAWDMQEWCIEKLTQSHPKVAFQIVQTLQERAPVDLRVNLKKATRDSAIKALADDGIECSALPEVVTALRVQSNPRKVKNSDAYLTGLVELQDAGSQALALALPLDGCRKILDYCAGGGGKSLAMAARSSAAIYAIDSNSTRMKDIPARAARAGVEIGCLDSSSLHKQAPFDLVLCDVPCSGSGSWRRSPDAKWRLSETDFYDLLKVQSEILQRASCLLAPDGYLCFATCSLFSEENEDQVNAFLESASNFELIFQKSWTLLDHCDGFHLSVMQLKET